MQQLNFTQLMPTLPYQIQMWKRPSLTFQELAPNCCDRTFTDILLNDIIATLAVYSWLTFSSDSYTALYYALTVCIVSCTSCYFTLKMKSHAPISGHGLLTFFVHVLLQSTPPPPPPKFLAIALCMVWQQLQFWVQYFECTGNWWLEYTVYVLSVAYPGFEVGGCW